MKRIAALVPNIPGVSPGQRVRIESWAAHLAGHGWAVDFYPFEDEELHRVIYQSGRPLEKAAGLARCYTRQLGRILRKPPCDVLFIYREAALVGPALIERLARRLRVPIVYDLDDPVFIPYRSPSNHWFSLLKFSRKTYSLFRLSDHVIAINNLIAERAARYNSSVTVIPNTVDTRRFFPSPRPAGAAPRLVWIGSHSTMPNLATIAAPLSRLQAETGAALRVIGVGEAQLAGVEAETRQWSEATEVADMQDCDIGLVPLTDLSWNAWKFFYKTVQYMALGLPVVARRIGSNCEVIEDGVNGFLVETEDEWFARLRELVADEDLRRRMGAAARRTVEERYSHESQMPRVVEVFEGALRRRGDAGLGRLARGQGGPAATGYVSGQ